MGLFSHKSLEKACRDTYQMMSGHPWEDMGTRSIVQGDSPLGRVVGFERKDVFSLM